MTRAEIAASSRQVEKKRHGFWYDLFTRLIREKPLGTFGLVIVILLFVTGIFANFIAPYPINAVHLAARLSSPSAKFLLGTDQLGTDVLSQIIYGARISMIIGVGGTVLSKLISTVIGVSSGFFGGQFDMIVQRFVDAFISVPQLLVLMTIMSIIGNGMFQVIVVMGIATGISSSRVIRSAVMAIKSNTYISAAEAIGCYVPLDDTSHLTEYYGSGNNRRHHNYGCNHLAGSETLVSLVTVYHLMYLLWGSMLSLEGEKYMQQAPPLALWPGFALSIVIYGINMFGDALRDLLDPRLRGGIRGYTINAKKLKKPR